jgi:hypothetical protein
LIIVCLLNNGYPSIHIYPGSLSWQYMAALQPPSDYIEKVVYDSEDEDIERYR